MEVLTKKLATLRLSRVEADQGSCLKCLKDLLVKLPEKGATLEADEKQMIKIQLTELLHQDWSVELQERVLLAVQLFAKLFDIEEWNCLLSRLPDKGEFLWLARLRADLVLDHQVPIGEERKLLEMLLNNRDSSRIAIACIIECATLLVAKEGFEGVDSAIEMVAMTLWQQDELILHKVRLLTRELAKRTSDPNKNTENSNSAVRLVNILLTLDENSKTRYLLLKDFLEDNVLLPGLSDAKSINLAQFFKYLVRSKALAPVISDCILRAIKRFGYEPGAVLGYLKELADDYGLLGQYFFPRLVTQLPLAAFLTIEFLAQECSSPLPTHTQQYCALYLAMANNPDIKKASIPLISRLIIKEALISPKEATRIAGFSCLCRSARLYEAVDSELGRMIIMFLVDLMLDGSSDSRQQAVASLKSLLEVHIMTLGQIYKQSNERNLDLAETILTLWKNITQLCRENITLAGHFNKNDLSLSILEGICELNRKKTQIYNNTIKETMQKAFRIILQPIISQKSLILFSTLALENSFSPVRSSGANLWKEIIALGSFRINISLEELSSKALDCRAHIVDGAALMLKAICEVDEKFNDIALNRLIDLIIKEVERLDAQNPTTFSSSNVLGLLMLIKALLLNAVTAQVLLEQCRQLCLLVLPLVSHPSPEGHNISIPDGIVDEEENCEEEDDGEDDRSFSLMNFSWRAIKVAGSVITKALQAVTQYFSETEWLQYGEFLVDLITRIRHPGAFVSLAKPIRDFCSLALSQGYSKIIDALFGRARYICRTQPLVQTTRRSAGLPFCFVSIISSIPHRKPKVRRQFLDQVWELVPSKLEDEECLPQTIHSLNILRQIFRDSALADDVGFLIPLAFHLSSRALTSPSWAIRNSGLLMFVALLNRTFGVCHDADDYSPVNCVDPRTIFARYGELFRSADDFADFAILQRYRWSCGGESRFPQFYQEAFEFAWNKVGSEKAKERRMTSRLLIHMAESPLLKSLLLERLQKTNLTHGYLEPLEQMQKANLIHGRLELLYLLEDRGIMSRENVRVILESSPAYQKLAICYPIRMLLGDPINMDSEVARDMTWQFALKSLKARAIPYSDIDATMHSLLTALLKVPESREQIMPELEGLWTRQYDLEGSYRRAIIRHWNMEIPMSPLMIRLWYLALTDEDEQIRYWASINFGSPRSVAFHLRTVIREYKDELGGLLRFMPQVEMYEAIQSRSALFSPEPLNSFKDFQWERLIPDVENFYP